MICDIYKSKKKAGAYLFMKAGHLLQSLPNPVFDELGELELFKQIDLISEKPLIAVSPQTVIKNIETNGYHIQRFKTETKINGVSELGAAVGGGILLASLGLGVIGAAIGAAVGLALSHTAKKEEE